MRIDRMEGIPKNTIYCYAFVEEGAPPYFGFPKTKRCKYFRYRKRGKRSKNYSTAGRNVYEYCKYLKCALSLGDSCKECGISEGWDLIQ